MDGPVLIVEIVPPEAQVTDELAKTMRAELLADLALPGAEGVGAGHWGERIRLLIITDAPDRAWTRVRGWLEGRALLGRTRAAIRPMEDADPDGSDFIWEGDRA